MEKIEFVDSTLSCGTSSGEYHIIYTPLMSNVQGPTDALNAKRNVSDNYNKTHIDNELSTAANQSDLLWIDTTSSRNYQQITPSTEPTITFSEQLYINQAAPMH